MSSIIGLFKRNYTAFFSPPKVLKSTSEQGSQIAPLKFGILGAAAIAPAALINPAQSHSDVVVYAIAARDPKRAEAFAEKYGIEKWYGNYQALLDDPEIDAVYNPLPNGLHYEWTMKALAAGKHVLLEKPSGDTAEETRRMFDLAENKGLILLEAFHYRFHPAIQRVKDIINSGELGKIKHISASLAIPKGIITGNDIRLDYNLGGGAMMDCGCYPLSCLRYLTSANPISVNDAKATVYRRNTLIDTGMAVNLTFPSASPSSSPPESQPEEPVTATLVADFATPWILGVLPRMPRIFVLAECEQGSVEMFNFVMPVIYHYIQIRPLQGKARTEKVYSFRTATHKGTSEDQNEKKGEEWWSTYRYQLEAFVDKVRGREPQTWVSREDSIANMEWIEKIYEKTNLGARPQSNFQLESSE
ncbi:hypothetical protein SERLA73DRAFT_183526 [Serpula lacrymans var. lacrymans S7.3]|uniref:D-xylose 1-dehydrogenase (NADP(+), D-xylono-1,5-lactone-forming) n=2 Tax=Serpula lacrymans var. lacrymans TaxID=341189 RepID=F8Q016_SERL3|nr:uncharacterized protein SERLADRAFT_470753 [Serpula lacrymans var. lacrymans S7.9]EGN98488.1 hypothetical protein SERLA73DRAFT_183526 [Serpula lacrymans var. lacrymans S7.3]EGO24065.1 hypothetical protein SERLADRAFT_470753 [Serpula lacrymans var. lacrymans S7.9]